jgi:hypothetical protein
VIIVRFESLGEGSILSWNVVSEAHCQATDSFVRARQAEFCCCGSWIGTAKGPLGTGPIDCTDDKLSPVVSVLASKSLNSALRKDHALSFFIGTHFDAG